VGGIKINNAYKPLITSKKRYFFLTGGRASLKSTTIHDFSSRLSYEKDHGILVTRYTMASAEKSIIPEFESSIRLNGSYQDFIKSGNKYTNKFTGSFILFSGIKTNSGDQTANLKSLAGITTWIIDEGEDFKDEKTFDDIDDSIRSNVHQNRIIWIQNPTTKEHFIYKRWIEGNIKYIEIEGHQVIISNHPKVEAIHTTYHIAENLGYLSRSFLDKINDTKLNNPDKYFHKYLGGWLEKAEGVVFTNWKYGEFNPDGLQTSCGMDFGFSIDPDSLTEVAIDKTKKRIYVKEHIYQKGIKSQDLAKIILNRVGNKLIIADSAEPRLIADLQALGVNIQAVKKGTVESGITRMQDYLIIVEHNSNNIAKELNNYIYADKGSKLYVDDWNHSIDGIRYNVIYHLDNPNKGNYNIY
jgi:phage terminase large subunit